MNRAQQLVVRLGGLYPRWIAFCADKRIRPSEAARQLVSAMLSHGRVLAGTGSNDIDETSAAPSAQRCVRRYQLSLSTAEVSLLEAQAAAHGVRPHQWLRLKIREEAGRALTQDGADALRESNRQVAGIARNLNQVARVLQAERKMNKTLDLSRLGVLHQLTGAIDVHLQAVQVFMEQHRSDRR